MGIVSLRSEIEKHRSLTSWVDVVNKDLIAELESNLRDKQVGLCAKWAPREGRHFGWLAKEMAIRMLWLGDAMVNSTEGLIWCSSLAKSSTTSDTDQHQLRLGIHILLYNCQLTSKTVPNQGREQSS